MSANDRGAPGLGASRGGASTVGASTVGASWRERVATLLVFLALGLATGTWAAAIPALRDALALDAAHLSLALFVIALASVASTLTMGVVAPRIGNGRLTGIAAAVALVGFALPGIANGFAALLACGLVIGAGAGALEVAINAHASDIEQRWGGAIMSSFHAAFSVGGLLGAALGGAAAAMGAGLRGQLWGPLALGALFVAAAWPGLGVGARGEPGAGSGLGRPSRAMLILGVAAMLCYLLEGAMADWSALYLTTVAGATAGAAAGGYAAFSVTMALGRATGDVVVRRLGQRRVLVLGGLVAAAGVAVAVAEPQPLVGAIGFALVGVGAANVVPVLFSAGSRTAPTPAAGAATVAMFGFAGFLGGPPLVGALATWSGLHVAIGSLALAGLAVAIAGALLPRD